MRAKLTAIQTQGISQLEDLRCAMSKYYFLRISVILAIFLSLLLPLFRINILTFGDYHIIYGCVSVVGLSFCHN